MLTVDVFSACGLLDQIYENPLDPDPWRIEFISAKMNAELIALFDAESMSLVPRNSADYYYIQINIKEKDPHIGASTEYVFSDPIFDMFYYFLMNDDE